MGLPIVLRPLPVYKGWLNYGDNCISAGNVDEFAQAVRKVYEDRELRDRLTGRAHEMAMGHNLRGIGEKLLMAYHEELGLEVPKPLHV